MRPAAGPDDSWATLVAQLGRTSLLGVTFAFTLQGMASAGTGVGAGRLGLALAAATAFHLAVYAWNDLVDLPIDRTEPRRARSPLVRGTVSPRSVAVSVLAAAALALALAAAGGPVAALCMAVALGLLGAYDVWGKRAGVPPVTDLLQGLGWAALACFGAAVAGEVTATTLWLAAFVVIIIMVINGIVGAVRDLANDSRHGARTTAILLGARVCDDGRIHLPPAVRLYGYALHLVAVAVVLLGLVATGAASPARLGIAVVVGGACLGLLAAGLATTGRPSSWRAGFGYIVLAIMLPSVLLVRLPALLAVALVVLFALPWAGSRWVRDTVRSLTRRAVEGVPT